MSAGGPLVDSFGRTHTDLRISVTDRCNVRCFYCMPPDGVQFRPHAEILSYEQIERFVQVAIELGICAVRLTGGEPLVRKDLPRLVEKLSALPGIEDLGLTTNGILLDRYARALKTAGLDRLNISVDTLSREKFRRITGRDELPRVLAGIDAAREAGFQTIKLNALAIRGLTEDEIVPLARFARENALQIRFIEFMPVDGAGFWNSQSVLPGKEILEVLSAAFGPLEPLGADGQHAPAAEFRLGTGGRVGVVHSVTEPFCRHCDRLRLTADGKLRNCLFSDQQWDVRSVLRGGGTSQQLAELVRAAVRVKRRGRGTDDGRFATCDRPMHQIGG